jgi:hypothetical protein
VRCWEVPHQTIFKAAVHLHPLALQKTKNLNAIVLEKLPIGANNRPEAGLLLPKTDNSQGLKKTVFHRCTRALETGRLA